MLCVPSWYDTATILQNNNMGGNRQQPIRNVASSTRPAACHSASLTSTASLTDFNQRLLDLDNQLTARGLTSLIDWPRIVFCGEQSSGKSSIIQRIAQINLPRAQGTCTRCPMELRMKHGNDPWSCTIKIRYMYDSNGDPLDSVKEEHFCTVDKREDVEASVARAQEKIL
ncbi:hypothetical protein DUNSADRAFT_4402 [Dunaliella salina]|uniref:Dynamin N-terminal domain-containing protein n=1 Tax=Dunaliella salina TaxID=3046 RepID=A0ABQ7GS70_DUNSA|nr:hypothetical protein DUNSADRAFT_4402 [Dunaliella salina]|eukprot:KAF5837422.1 hypothetical protein DUNSADRAFT_4402 [Dunaliella salina]